jgi:pyridoxine 5-phosphate synthase
VTLVPERRQEVTTEGGLEVVKQVDAVRAGVQRFLEAGIDVSLFIDPDPAQVAASAKTGARRIELHTGSFAEARHPSDVAREVERLRRAADAALEHGLHLALGHGLDYRNVVVARDVPHVEEMNIGHSIVSRAVFVGLREAVREMKRLLGG